MARRTNKARIISELFEEGGFNPSSNDVITFDNSYKQWSVGENGKYIPCFSTVPKVPPGIYEMRLTNNLGFHIERQAHLSDDLMELPMSETKEILDDIQKFWEKEAVFERYGYTHKRGILLYGPPGNGKSYLIQVLSRHIIQDMQGIVLNLKDYDSVELFLDFAGPVIRTIEPKTPIIVILEDVDNILEYSNSTLTKLLNMLDGLKQINRVVYIATTNYPEKLQERVSNRPSRFDVRYKISKPNAKVREFYIKNKLKPEDLKTINVKEWVKRTKGFSVAHLRELVIACILLGHSFDETVTRLHKMNDEKLSSRIDERGIGFSNKSMDATYDIDEDEDY